MIVGLLAEHNLGFLRLEGSCAGLSGSALVKMPQFFLKSHATAHMIV